MKTVYCILPVYCCDSVSLLIECLNSIDRMIIPQDISFRLCLAVDGGLSRNLENCISHFRKNTNKSLTIFHNPKLTGLPANLNNVIRKLNLKADDLIMRMDADDIILPMRLVIQAKFLSENPSIDVVASCATKIDEHEIEIFNSKSYIGQVYPNTTRTNPIIHPTVLIRSEFFLKYGFYDEKFKYAQDWELWARASKRGAMFFVLPDKLIKFRFVPKSIKRRKHAQYFVIRLAWRHLKDKKLKFLVLFRSVMILLLPTFVISLFLKINTVQWK